MTPAVSPVAALLADLAARGVELAVEADRLSYRPPAAVPPNVARRLRTHKGALVDLIRGSSSTTFSTAELAVLATVPSATSTVRMIVAAKAAFAEIGGLTLVAFEPTPIATTSDQLSAEWREAYEERAAIMEFDGGLPRKQAEALALRDIQALMEGAVRPLAPGMSPVGER